ncbi:MAG: hypothetical protein KGM96_14615 [Acidobacteriota bacterium]|nr:hypothetical protein [Acidobacteriota bacterium]
MTFSFARTLSIATVAAVLAAVSCAAQSSTKPAQSDRGQQPQSPKPGGKVIFSRSADEDGVSTQAGPEAQPAIAMAREPAAEDADRRAVTFTDLALDVHLQAAAHRIAVRALVTVRNDGKTPLKRIPLQISSSLNWEQIRVGGRDVSFPVAVLNSDADHTGQLHEAAVPLAEPLAPGAALQLDVTYSGEVTASAQRLLAVGTPEALALRSDWDQITVPFTGLRGFGNVVWYPVASVPVILGDGARLFDEIGTHKLRLAGAHFGLRLTVEFPYGQQPTVALINGQPTRLTVTAAGRFGPDVDGIATAGVDSATLGFEAPSLFVAIRKAHPGANLTAWTLAENEIAVQSWLDAATAVTPFVEDWLGKTPRAQLTLLDLPDPDDAPYETGALLAISLHEGSADRLQGVLVHALTHAWMQSPRAWVSEGVATFMGTLWVEKRRGRDDALGVLEADRAALALAEPASPGESAGQPLAVATAPVYYRTKAAYVLWMLRDMVGNEALSSALRAYDPARDSGPGKGGGLLEELVKKAGAGKDLSWFFADWVDADKGLPDLSIESVFPSPAQGGAWLVAVNLANAGYAAAEVPVTVRTAKTTVTERVLIPARGKVVKRLLIMGKPTEAQVNDGTVPETQASVHVTHLEDPATAPAGSSQSNPPPQ